MSTSRIIRPEALIEAEENLIRRKRNAHSFTPIWSIILKAITHNYADYVNYLESCGVIQISRSYRPGVYARKMRIALKVEGLREVKIRDPRLLKRIRRKRPSFKPDTNTIADKFCFRVTT